ncbi:MAG: hypothetical protein L3J83_02710 [Proteobacteria bacterium]|nr:hypothetical protein [Pseudomonadota bacterium]
MVVLKKIKASTLMETLVATVLIVVVFMISSMILNNLFSNSIKNNTRAIDAHLNELQYRYQNEKLMLPYQDDFKAWKVSIESFKENGQTTVLFEALNTNTNKTLEKALY